MKLLLGVLIMLTVMGAIIYFLIGSSPISLLGVPVQFGGEKRIESRTEMQTGTIVVEEVQSGERDLY